MGISIDHKEFSVSRLQEQAYYHNIQAHSLPWKSPEIIQTERSQYQDSVSTAAEGYPAMMYGCYPDAGPFGFEM